MKLKVARSKVKRRMAEAKQDAPLHYDDADLGAGRANGGSVCHRKARRALFMRLIEKAAPLPAELQANLERQEQ